jgi:hypothetical protein
MSRRWRPCYSAPTAPEAHVVKGFLEGRGVPCLLRADGASMYPVPVLGAGVDVLVPDDWFPVAQQMVARRRRRRPGTRVVRLASRRRRG